MSSSARRLVSCAGAELLRYRRFGRELARAAASIELPTPGLSVIIDAMKESCKIFQRIQQLRDLPHRRDTACPLLLSRLLLVFNFYPLTAVVTQYAGVAQWLCILFIAYDNVHYKDMPEAWNTRMVLGISTVLGLTGSPRVRV